MKKVSIFIFIISVALIFSGCTLDDNDNSYTNTSISASTMLEVIVFTTGSGDAADAILLRTENHNIMIDTSTNKGFKDVNKYFADNEITIVDCLILTHFDNGHMGGADKLFDITKVQQVIMPKYDKDSKQYNQMMNAMNEHSLIPTILTENLTFVFDDVIFEFYPPERDFYGKDEDNDFSIITSVTHGNNKFLFMGDAESARTLEYLQNKDISHQFLKVPYHGRFKAEYAELFAQVNPDYAVITCSTDELADVKILKLLQTVGSKIYQTMYGTVIAKSDGKELTVMQLEE